MHNETIFFIYGGMCIGALIAGLCLSVATLVTTLAMETVVLVCASSALIGGTVTAFALRKILFLKNQSGQQTLELERFSRLLARHEAYAHELNKYWRKEVQSFPSFPIVTE